MLLCLLNPDIFIVFKLWFDLLLLNMSALKSCFPANPIWFFFLINVCNLVAFIIALAQLALIGIFIPNCRDPSSKNHPSKTIIYNSRAEILLQQRPLLSPLDRGGTEVRSHEVLCLNTSSKPAVELAPVPQTVCYNFLAVDHRNAKKYIPLKSVYLVSWSGNRLLSYWWPWVVWTNFTAVPTYAMPGF